MPHFEPIVHCCQPVDPDSQVCGRQSYLGLSQLGLKPGLLVGLKLGLLLGLKLAADDEAAGEEHRAAGDCGGGEGGLLGRQGHEPDQGGLGDCANNDGGDGDDDGDDGGDQGEGGKR